MTRTKNDSTRYKSDRNRLKWKVKEEKDHGHSIATNQVEQFNVSREGKAYLIWTASKGYDGVKLSNVSCVSFWVLLSMWVSDLE